MLQHRLQVFQIEQQQPMVIGNFEDKRKHAGLRVVEVQDAAQQQRPQLRNCRAHRMPLLAEHIPESDRAACKPEIRQPQLRDACLQLGTFFAGHADAGKITLHIGRKHRHPDTAERFSHHLQRDGLAGTGGAGNQPMTVSHRGQKQ